MADSGMTKTEWEQTIKEDREAAIKNTADDESYEINMRRDSETFLNSDEAHKLIESLEAFKESCEHYGWDFNEIIKQVL